MIVVDANVMVLALVDPSYKGDQALVTFDKRLADAAIHSKAPVSVALVPHS